MTTNRFPKTLRLLRPVQFQRVFKFRCSTAGKLIVLYGAYNDFEHPRLGLTVSRKVGNAVFRNRWKRVLREAFRQTQHELAPLDLICLPRPKAMPKVNQLIAEVPDLVKKLERQLKKKNYH